MRRGILLLLNHELSIEGKKKGKGKGKKERRNTEARKLLIERNYSEPFSYPIGKNSRLENLDRTFGWKKETGRKEGKKFLSSPGSRDNLNQRASRVKAKLPCIGRFDIDPNRGKIMEKPSFAFYRIARRIWNFNRASPPEKSPLDRVVDASRRKWRDTDSVSLRVFYPLLSLK